MSFLYNIYKNYFTNIKDIINTTQEDTSITNNVTNTKEVDDHKINLVICRGSQCKTMIFVKENCSSFPLCTNCIKKYSS